MNTSRLQNLDFLWLGKFLEYYVPVLVSAGTALQNSKIRRQKDGLKFKISSELSKIIEDLLSIRLKFFVSMKLCQFSMVSEVARVILVYFITLSCKENLKKGREIRSVAC